MCFTERPPKTLEHFLLIPQTLRHTVGQQSLFAANNDNVGNKGSARVDDIASEFTWNLGTL